MIDYEKMVVSVIEQLNSSDDLDDIDFSFLRYLFPLIEPDDVDSLNDCNESIPAKNVSITGYYINIDENYISIYISLFDENIKYGEIIKEKNFIELRDSFLNLMKMIDDNSYLDINESMPIFDLCDFIVRHRGMDIIANIVTNYMVPAGYDKDGIISTGSRSIGLKTYDIKDILDKINANNASNSTLNLIEKFGKGIPAVLISSNDDIDVYLTSIPGEWLAQLYKEDSIGLLSANVRSYLKRTNRVNKEIIETVKDAPEEFVAYNNGLSAIATDIKRDGINGFYTIDELTDFLIVNGGQTTANLYECKNDRLDLSKITVPAKISIIKNQASSEYLISNISIYSNLQTAIKKSDPSSNSKFYIKFEDISKTVLAKKGSIEYHCFFERTTGQYNTIKRMHTKKTDPFINMNPEKCKFTKLQLAQSIISWEQMPDMVCKGQEKNFEYFHSVAKDLNVNIIDENYFKSSYALIIIYRQIDKIIKKLQLPYKSTLVAYTLAFLSLYTNRKLDLMRIWENQSTDSILDDVLKKMVNDVYEKLIDSPKEYPDIRMWSRKSECWDKVKTINSHYDLSVNEKQWEFLPENTAKVFIENNIKNSELWKAIEQWANNNNIKFNEKQLKMIHAMPTIIYKDDKSIKKMSKKQEAFAKSIFLVAAEQGFDYERPTI